MCVEQKNERTAAVEIAQVFRQHGDHYCLENKLTPEQYKVMNAIKNCRTRVLGGHMEQCDYCLGIQCSYNSCRNRHCPKCESFKAAQWIEDRKAELLPVPYFHVVFTLPHELNNTILYNKKILYNLLFQAAWKALNTLGEDKNRLGGEMGMIAILHTWSQTLSQHNHLHCIVPGGALKANGQWQSAKKYLFPVKVLSKLFRRFYVAGLREIVEKNGLKLPDQLTDSLTSLNVDQWLNELMSKEWVVYAKPPFAGPEKLLNYLARYTHKIAISNHRILACDDEFVTFQWRDYSDENKIKIMQLKPQEFIRRFLSHVLPDGFIRIRGFGFLANACKAKKVKIIQEQLHYQPKKSTKDRSIAERMLELTGQDITLCPLCKKGHLKRISDIPSQLNKTMTDTS